MFPFHARIILNIAVFVLLLQPVEQAGAQNQEMQNSDAPFAVEYYYKVQWGHFDEFLELYKRNHYPILERLQELGRIVGMSAAYPVNHAGEGSRWDFRFTIVWKNAATAYEDFDESPIVMELYPDQDLFRQEERRRFELLLEHMDVPVRIEDPSTWTE